VQILQLRAKKAKFGFPTFAHWNLSNKMAKTRAHNGVDDVSMGLRLRKCIKMLHPCRKFDAEGGNFKISPWIIVIIREKVRKKNTIWTRMWSKYLQLENQRRCFGLLVSCLIAIQADY
jgi:peptidyl-dipeptidase Dcp